MVPSTTTIRVGDAVVHQDGAQGPVLLMLHGWPDTHRLWDATVAELAADFRCVRLTLPGFDRSAGPAAMGLADTTALLRGVVDAVSPGQPVTLLLHDWGCVFGYEFAARHPQQVQGIVAVDIGDYNSGALRRELGTAAKLGVFGYQIWLALAWKIGGALGDRMTRWMARQVRCPTLTDAVGCHMNYPYAMAWFGSLGGFGGAAPVRPEQPVLYVYGTRKPFMFHSRAWLSRLQARADCAVAALPTGHWVMVQKPQVFMAQLRDWLGSRATPPQEPCLPAVQPRAPSA